MKKITHRTEMMSIIGKKRIPIRLQFGIFIILFTTALAASILFFTIKGQKEVLVKERTTVGQTLTAHLAAAAKDAILLEDDLYVYDMINDMVKNDAEKDIRYIFVTDSSGKILIHNKTDQLGDTLTDDITRAVIKSTVSSINKTTLNGEAVVDYARPVIENFSRKTIGYARIGISEESINRVVNQSARQMITIAIAVLLIGLAASLFWVRLVTKPVSLLADGAEKIGKGDLKYRFKIEARNELGELAEIFNRMTGDLDLAQQELVAKQRLDHELDLARSLQAALLPDKLPDTEQIDITAWYKAAKQVGGDYYDFINVDDSHLGIVIADVSGKSITGAFMMGITRASMRAIAPGILSPREVLIKLNEQMCANMRKGMFVTMLY
ncbi:MAG: HAMP domain-containing protein, partial [Fibrobacteres bacterium]|nr:HAMP domain-containing protein [Fibrobacterota bacterium]